MKVLTEDNIADIKAKLEEAIGDIDAALQALNTGAGA